MNIRCPSCQTMFRVDPARIPASGVRARCARCGNTFHVAGQAAADGTAQPAFAQAAATDTPTTAAPPPATPAATPTPAFAPPAPPPTPAAAVSAPAGQGAIRPLPPPPSPPPVPAAPPSAEPPRAGVFGSPDPQARAQRMARALVSDIVAYHPKRRDACLEAGTLRTEFRDEIMKSWEEYVAQVGLEMAKSTPYFRDALNAILANGQNLF
ncbi:MAG TPA: zinc-ribbon domain-containing protein [Longimicrobiales bacterium]|nr:zinc-ribbon domain-containing protein [Longimicrobiales bacterium]